MSGDRELDFLLGSASLGDLLGILAAVCERLDLERLDARVRGWREFRFVFFGLLVKANGLLDMMVYRVDALRAAAPYGELSARLIPVRDALRDAYKLVRDGKLREGTARIVEAERSYRELKDLLVEARSARSEAGRSST